MNPLVTLRFDRGTLRLDGFAPSSPPADRLLWDPRTRCWRGAAHHYVRVTKQLQSSGVQLRDEVGPLVREPANGWTKPTLRPYQRDALQAWEAFGRRGVVALPTGSGKTRVAVAALASCETTALILCPTRALTRQWVSELSHWYPSPIGIVGDGVRRVEPVTVMTFESAYRQLDRMPPRFGTLVVDEAHHFGSGIRAEALEMCPAPARLGLTATPPAAGTAAESRLDALLGPVVCEVALEELLGTHLANLVRTRLHVCLEPDERDDYEAWACPFEEARRSFFRAYPSTTLQSFLRTLGRSAAGRKLIRDYRRAEAIATFPRAKRRLVQSLLRENRDVKTLVFTARADDAYAVALDNLIPVVTAEVGRAEREEILTRFRAGSLHAIAAARVLNEGIDVPDATVAILVGGALGEREYFQRIGRVLRPAAGKTARVVEIVTIGTLDNRRADARWRNLAA